MVQVNERRRKPARAPSSPLRKPQLLATAANYGNPAGTAHTVTIRSPWSELAGFLEWSAPP
ncbi:hypothetical protein ACFOLD_09115 [Kocuria carniphila]|uniref:hypothetical protein n=1 Tax=Kocuria carniphila TaxID=262208 RepID=UPI003607FB82